MYKTYKERRGVGFEIRSERGWGRGMEKLGKILIIVFVIIMIVISFSKEVMLALLLLKMFIQNFL